MAGNKMNTKTKGREEKGKTSGRIMDQNEESEDIDFSLLRKPISTSVTGFGQARKIFDLATEELKTLLSDECDIMYECKVCRNIFRSLANFISHKRVYCKEKFNSTVHGHFIKSTSTLKELIKIKQCEQNYQEFLKEHGSKMDMDEVDERVPMSKDLTEIVENIANKKNLSNNNNYDELTVVTQKVPNSSVAVFQTIEPKEGQYDNIRVQVKELNQILSKDTAVLQNDGKFKIRSTVPNESDNVIQISDDEDNDVNENHLTCKICDMKFSTRKTLKFHMNYKHVESRLVYPCPDCLEIFSTSWSVYRHLYKVHRKSLAQIRRLRESIQSKAFKMNNPPAFYEKRKNNIKTAMAQKLSEEERLDQENQAWMDNMEGNGEGPRCGGCGRAFERRAALAAHTHTCVSRTRALAAARLPRKQDNKRIQIQIRRDYHKEPITANIPTPSLTSGPHRPADVNDVKTTEEEMLPSVSLPKSPQNEAEICDKMVIEDTDASEEEQTSQEVKELPEINCSTNNEIIQPVIRFPLLRQVEKGNLAALKDKIQPDIDLDLLACKKCETRCNTIQELYDHAASHYKWMRYACKLCNYKHYLFEKLQDHVRVVHKLKGDKDFYFSSVKAIDAAEALELADNAEESNETRSNSPDSRRPSRCSSDSSRLSDDSSSSSTKMEAGSRKRKPQQNKMFAKKRKEVVTKSMEELRENPLTLDKFNDNDSSSNVKSFEENSSDLDEIDDKIVKRFIVDTSSVASGRPVRKKVKPKNEDFEYDLSNLLKMEAQGYRESQPTITPKPQQPKKKIIQQEIQVNYDSLNRESSGALINMSKKAVEKSKAHMKVTNFSVFYSHKEHTSSVFARPMIPRISKDKSSPKKDIEDKKSSSPNKDQNIEEKKNTASSIKEQNMKDKKITVASNKILNMDDKNFTVISSKVLNMEDINLTATSSEVLKIEDKKNATSSSKEQSTEDKTITNSSSKEQKNYNIHEKDHKNVDKQEINTMNNFNTIKKPTDPKNRIRSIVPIKFRRQSLEVMKSPLINKNMKELAKAGMKTKILVIKPINRNQDGSKGTLTTPLKYQTITLKDPNKSSSSDEKSDQVVVVKVPKVDCAIPKTVKSTVLSNEAVKVTTTTPTLSNEYQQLTVKRKEALQNTINTESFSSDNQLEEAVIEESDLMTYEELIIEENSIKGNETDFNLECDNFQNGAGSRAIEEEVISMDNDHIISELTDNCDIVIDPADQTK